MLFTAFAFADASVDYFNRGVSYKNLGNHSSAIRDYTEAIRLNPKHAAAYNNRGVLYALLGNYLLATKDARKACALGECKALEWMGKNGFISD